MTVTTAADVYERYVKPLPRAERLRLVSVAAHELASEEATERPRRRSILELHGLGAEIWEGVDAQEYVNQLRQEWDHRP